MTDVPKPARWLGLVLTFVLLVFTSTARAQTFSNEQLAQMLAPIALFPDSLLSQVLMAATYPTDVAEAASWVKANPNQTGDAAVKAVADQPWDPSVQSLVAFPQVLQQMGDNPKWVKDVGDAFLAEPERVLDQVQLLRRRAYDAGNLKTTEQQKVVVQPAPAAPAPAVGAPAPTVNQQQIIVIEPAQPQVVFVPTYNPTVVFGTWMYPAFPPVYFPPPPGVVFGNALLSGIAFGAGIAISNALWGGFNWGWGRSNVNINVNRFNNINVNRPLNVNQNNVAWNHNPANRRDVPYRDAQSRQRFDSQRVTANNNRPQGGALGSAGRDQYRGRDVQRNASREQAQAALQNRGVDVSQARDQLRNDPQARERAQAAAQNVNRDRAGAAGQNANRDRVGAAGQNIDRDRVGAAAQNVDRDRARQAAQNVDRDQARQAAQNAGQNVNRDQVRTATQNADRDRARAAAQNVDRERAQQAAQNRPRDNALSGAGDAARSRQAADRGQASREAMQNRAGNAPRPSPGAGGGDRGGARAAAGARAGGGGGGGARGGGGGHRGR